MWEVMRATNPLIKLGKVFTSARENLDRERYYRAKESSTGSTWSCRTPDSHAHGGAALDRLEMEGDGELAAGHDETPASGIGWTS